VIIQSPAGSLLAKETLSDTHNSLVELYVNADTSLSRPVPGLSITTVI